ncbi:pentatricopeptide repeat-containing protein At1g76280 isoform X1 [Setaria italica]|nr:pentatricopeptide repeat-containing protein At1g76280 isoform X1 [Setaria italica]XP_022680255.1 pentatricopeptide repeat-containing protein At1g76280 isoform X1 [Setaria italica]
MWQVESTLKTPQLVLMHFWPCFYDVNLEMARSNQLCATAKCIAVACLVYELSVLRPGLLPGVTMIALPLQQVSLVYSMLPDLEYDDFTWKTTLVRSMQADIVNALRRGDRQRASIILSNFQNTNWALNKEDFSYILEYCAEAPDPLFVMETLELMEEKAIGMSKGIYRYVIRALSRGGYVKEALHWLMLLGEKESTHATLPFFNIFLNACGSSANLKDVECCLETMENYLLGKSEITYCELLKIAVLQQNLPAVYDIWKDCTRYYSPSIITQRRILRALTAFGDLQSAYHILQHMVTSAAQRSEHLRLSSKRRYQSSRLDIPVLALSESEDLKLLPDFSLQPSQGKLATGKNSADVQPELLFAGNNLADKVELDNGTVRKTLRLAQSAVRRILIWSFNDLMHACVQFNNCQLAEQLFLEMQILGLRWSKFTYDGFVKTLIAGKGIAYAMKVIETMERRGIKPYNDTLSALSEGYSKNLQLDLAEDLLERISEIRPKHIHAINALLSGCDIMNEPERAVRILAKMKRVNMKATLRTYELLFSLFGNVNVPYEEGNVLSHVDVSKRISIIEMDMLNNEIQHSFVSMKNLIRAFGDEGMIEEMLRYLNVAEKVLWNINPYQKSDLYSVALHALVKAKESHKAIRIFKIMRSCGLPTDVSIYTTMIECCKWLPCFKSASALLSLMLQDGFHPTVVTYTSLLKVVLAKDDFEGALDLLDICKTERIEPDIQIFNTVLSRAYARGQIHVIEYIVERIHRAKIQPNPSTLVYTFCAYEEHELYNTAIEALQVLSTRMISEDANILSEKITVFEDLILSEEPDAELRIIRAFEAAEEFLATALLNLRWCAIMGATISWSPEESLWARRLASSYNANKRPHIIPLDVPQSS